MASSIASSSSSSFTITSPASISSIGWSRSSVFARAGGAEGCLEGSRDAARFKGASTGSFFTAVGSKVMARTNSEVSSMVRPPSSASSSSTMMTSLASDFARCSATTTERTSIVGRVAQGRYVLCLAISSGDSFLGLWSFARRERARAACSSSSSTKFASRLRGRGTMGFSSTCI